MSTTTRKAKPEPDVQLRDSRTDTINAQLRKITTKKGTEIDWEQTLDARARWVQERFGSDTDFNATYRFSYVGGVVEKRIVDRKDPFA